MTQGKPIEVRFWAKVNREGPIPIGRPELGSCWLWTSTIGNKGYGQFYLNGQNVYAYRVALELSGRPITPGLEPDHLCRVRACVRPAHMELVTRRENFLRGSHPNAIAARTNRCRSGRHELTADNVRVSNGGRRRCRTCELEGARERYARVKAVAS